MDTYANMDKDICKLELCYMDTLTYEALTRPSETHKHIWTHELCYMDTSTYEAITRPSKTHKDIWTHELCYMATLTHEAIRTPSKTHYLKKKRLEKTKTRKDLSGI